MGFRGLSPTSPLLNLLGMPMFGMGLTPTTVKPHGLSFSGGGLGFLPECECPCVYLRRPSISDMVISTELEGCVKGYENAIFQSCSSVSEGNIKFQLFTQRVVEMFANSDPFSGVESLMPRQKEERREATPAPQLTAPVQVTPTNSLSSLPPQVAESSRAASKRRAVDPPLNPPQNANVTPLQKSKVTRPGEGWYVVHTGVLPGVYYGA